MTVRSEDENSRRCVAAALALCFAHILTIAGTDYQEPLRMSELRMEHLGQLGLFFLVNYGIFLSPIFLLLLIRRVCVLVGIFAIPILIIFVMRMYYVWQFYWFGINSMAVQKGDGLNFLTMVFEMLSAAIAAPLLLVIFLWKLTWRE
jgi:hypothetical protein